MLKPKSIQRAAKLCLWTAGDASILVVPPREAFRFSNVFSGILVS